MHRVAFCDLDVRVKHKGDKRRDVPILDSLANELRLHLRERRTGPVFQNRQGGAYSKRRLQQIVREVARTAGIATRVYPHLLRHTVAQHLADPGMPDELLQKFLGHEKPETNHLYYRPARTRMKRSFKEALEGQSEGEGGHLAAYGASLPCKMKRFWEIPLFSDSAVAGSCVSLDTNTPIRRKGID